LRDPLSRELEARLAGAKRLVLLGVGSELRSDDAAGLIAARAVRSALPRRKDLLVLEGGSAPENFTGEILRFEASHLVVVDCADLGLEPGSIRLIPSEEIKGLSSSTHSLPLSIILAYLDRCHACETIVIGIQPSGLEFDGKPSKEARRAAAQVARLLVRAARGMNARG